MPIFEPFQRGVPLICPSHPSIDYPVPWPEEVTFVGPVIAPYTPLSEVDPAMEEWLKRGPTLVISLGTHALLSHKSTQEMALALETLLDSRPDLQILWKLKHDAAGSGAECTESLREVIDTGRMRLVDWIKADLVAVLASRNVIGVVHHGGANSFFEATW
jgi:UDP:flavonoid glycosyltransferase YjiC (YdhE family)